MLRAWIVVAVCFIVLFMGSGPVYYAYGNYAEAWTQEFGAPRSVVNIGFTVVSLLGNVGAAPVGMLIDRINVRHLAALGMGGTALGFFLISLCHGIWPIVLLFSSLVAMADICIGVVITNYVLSHWFARRRALALGLSLIGTSLAGVVFPPLTDQLLSAHGWRTTMMLYAGVMALLVPLVWWLVTLPREMPAPERPPAPAADTPVHSPTPLPLRRLAAMPAFWIISIGAGAVTGANTGLMVSLVGFAKARGLSSADGSVLISVLAICAMISKAAFGAMADRIGYRNALRLGVGLGVLGNVILAPASSHAQMLLGVAVFGAGLGSILPVWGAALAATVGLPSLGRALGWSRVIWAPISMLFPVIAGWVFDRTGDYGWAWTAFAAILACAFVATLFWRGPRRAVRAA